MAIQRKTKVLNLARAARKYLAQKSETEIARMLHLRGRIGSVPKKSGRRLSASCFWQRWEIYFLGKHPDKETARRTGRSVGAVLSKRVALHIPVFNGLKDWREWELKLLGKIPDEEVVRRTGRTSLAVRNKRKKLRIVQANSPHKGWREWERKLLGKYSDKEVARRTGRTVVCVSSMRHYLRIKGFGAPCGRPRWPQREIDLLGKVSDNEVARRTGRKRSAVYVMRRKLGVERFGGRLRRWTKAEDKFLRQRKSNEEIARLTNRTVLGVKARRQLLRIP
jgi:hypothetical protein